MKTPRLSDLVAMDRPEAIYEEMEEIVGLLQAVVDMRAVRQVFDDVVALFEGRYPGYRECKLEYHSLRHTTDVAIAMVRLIHGAVVEGEHFSGQNITTSIVASLLHDTGYIQEESDIQGTGAKYTTTHVLRSIEFMRTYFAEHGWDEQDAETALCMLQCTGLTVDFSTIEFLDDEVLMLGRMLGTADLLGQMADREYLEKLLFLYHEFEEGKVQGFESEQDLLEKTIGFYGFTRGRFAKELGGVDRFMLPHFRARWNLDKDLYVASMDGQIEHLKRVLSDPAANVLEHLRRGGLVEKLQRIKDAK